MAQDGHSHPPQGRRGMGGLQGHLPACPWAVAVRTSRTRSERGCEVLGIFRGRLAEGWGTARSCTPRWAPLPHRCWG